MWAVMSDGSVHPAPCAPTLHLWWGDGWGDRPTEAYFVVNHLLDAPATAPDFHLHWKRAPAGLTALLSKEHQAGAELTRAVLLHARMTQPRR
ncbi:hypothetical protein GCM10023205_71220 [Yinghuangia aomiensis]|uniref:Uncharacterized protein n=1 Tax=Yinghuangia aomiensis TaxID=676205 RepID=A0ABP9I7X5_9ACTN